MKEAQATPDELVILELILQRLHNAAKTYGVAVIHTEGYSLVMDRIGGRYKFFGGKK